MIVLLTIAVLASGGLATRDVIEEAHVNGYTVKVLSDSLRTGDVLEISGPAGDSRRARAVSELPAWKKEAEEHPYSKVFPPAVELMYGGHEDLGWLYVRTSWGGPRAERLRLERKLRELLSRSPYYGRLVSGRRELD
jgi:hypothetical protein